MAESEVRSIFGIHDIRFFSRSTWFPVAYYKVLGDVNIDMPAEFVDLKGGSNLFSWASAVSSFKPAVSIVARQISADIVGMNLDADLTETTADSDGDVTDEANVNGTTIINATTGIATVTLKSSDEGDAKEGWYVIKCPTAGATVNVYSFSSSDFSRGTRGVLGDDDGLITSSPVTITTGGTTDLADYGIRFTGGSGAIAFTEGHTACFYVQKPHGGAYSAIIGAQPLSFSEYGCNIVSETESGVQYNMLLYRVKPAGMSLPFKEKGYGEYNVNMSVLYDSVKNAFGVLKATTPE